MPSHSIPNFPAQSISLIALTVIALVMLPATSKVRAADEVPEILAAYFDKDKTVSGEVGAIMPPEEINKYIAKVKAASKANPEWYAAYAKEAKPGIPLPWHENLGLTKEDYEAYLKLWDQRQFKAMQQVVIRLEEPKPGK